MKLDQLVSVVNGEPLASTEVIAKGVGVQHKNVLSLVRNHAGLLAEFGPLAFETRMGKPLRQGGFAKATEIAMLNERQTTLLLTLMRNSDKVSAFKVELIREFYRMRDALQQRDKNLWQKMQALIAHEVESKVRASFGSSLMLERKREIPHFRQERERLEHEMQPDLPIQ